MIVTWRSIVHTITAMKQSLFSEIFGDNKRQDREGIR